MLRESEVFVYYFDVLILLCCRWATGSNYRITFKSKRDNLQRQRRPYTRGEPECFHCLLWYLDPVKVRNQGYPGGESLVSKNVNHLKVWPQHSWDDLCRNYIIIIIIIVKIILTELDLMSMDVAMDCIQNYTLNDNLSVSGWFLYCLCLATPS